jgi:ABC-type dipeptide/oligopeptide/nickel transport system permease component
MLRFTVIRFLQGIIVLAVVYTATFWLLMAAPGDPFVGEKAVPEATRAALEARYGLHNPVEAYVRYPYQLLFHFNLGPTISYEDWTVGQVIRASLPVSIALGSLALILAMWAGVLIGTLSALHKGRPLDVSLTVLTLFGVSLPTFVIGTMGILLFTVFLPVFPSGGWGSLRQILLPALTLSLFFVAYISRITRVSVLDTLSADYVRTARAKGLPQRTIIGHHVLANAALPVLSYLGPAAAYALTGSFIIEKIFAIPGLGTHFVNACLNKDIPLVLGAVLTYTAVVVLFSFLVDLAYAAVDPRIALK